MSTETNTSVPPPASITATPLDQEVFAAELALLEADLFGSGSQPATNSTKTSIAPSDGTTNEPATTATKTSNHGAPPSGGPLDTAAPVESRTSVALSDEFGAGV